jgi:tRNA(fMet)-specific endonuclease VapC
VKYLLDTDHISILQRRSGAEYAILSSRMAQQAPAGFGVSIVSFHEQMLGAQTYISRARTSSGVIRSYSLLGEILRAFSAAPVLAFDAPAAAVFDALQARKIRVGTMDLRIAATALSLNLVLLTRNVSDFSRVPGLVTFDWTV